MDQEHKQTDRDRLQPFYQSQEWKDCRAAYSASVSYLCEDCRAKGLYTPGKVVHHLKPITLRNVRDPAITLNWDNLRLLCQSCHAARHSKPNRRYTVDENGNVFMLDSPPPGADG